MAVWMLVALTTLATACARRPGVERGGGGPPRAPGEGAQGPDAGRLYRQMGLIAESDGVPFVAAVSYFAAGTPDSTLLLVSLSLANRSLEFVREQDRYRAAYFVRLGITRDGTPVRTLDSREFVRVATFKETTRADESIIFQQVMTLAPGKYQLTVAVRDDARARSGSEEAQLTVPLLRSGSLSTPIAFYEVTPRATLDSAPRIVTNPRSTAVFGRDSLVRVYVEGYGTEPDATIPLLLTARGETGAVLWRENTVLPRSGALHVGAVSVPIARVGLGVVKLEFTRPGSADTVSSPLFVSFGEDLPVATFADMLDYLRYFTTPERLRTLRDTTPEGRASAWVALLRDTDPVLSTPEHEALTAYFARLARANELYRDEATQGWRTHRGMVFIALGEPDNMYVQSMTSQMNSRGRTQVWQYREYSLQLIFVDQSGFNRWRLTPSSEQQFRMVQRRLLSR